MTKYQTSSGSARYNRSCTAIPSVTHNTLAVNERYFTLGLSTYYSVTLDIYSRLALSSLLDLLKMVLLVVPLSLGSSLAMTGQNILPLETKCGGEKFLR